MKVWLSEIQFSDGTKVQLGDNDIVVLVGPNNAGKSVSLKDAYALLDRKDIGCKVIQDVKIEKDGSVEEVLAYLKRTSFWNKADPVYRGFGFSVHETHVPQHWEGINVGLGTMRSVFADVLTTEERLRAADPASSIPITTEAARHPIHVIQKNQALEERVSLAFRQAFGTDLMLHRNAGSQVPFYIGDTPNDQKLSIEFAQKVESMDLLQEQGDGMRSFVGVLLKTLVSNHSILFIDEPEAFLHPPQARLLGKMLSKDLPPGKQLFLATHSEDFLKGLLDANPSNLKVIRIQRDGAKNHVRVLNNNEINTIWKDSLLRHSDVLKGLFHSQVVICESDSDCRFYSAVLSAMFDDGDLIAPDILFIHCGGKDRMPTAIKALRKLDVQVKVVTDFDVLSNVHPLKMIFEDLDGNWSDVQSDWSMVKKEIEQKRPELLADEVAKEIRDVFASSSNRHLSDEQVSEIKKALRKASPWSAAKTMGKTFIPSGNATQAFVRLQCRFKEKGLLVLEVGELERFVPSVGNHGPKWVAEVLEKDLKNSGELEDARQFVRQFTTESHSNTAVETPETKSVTSTVSP